MPKIVIIEVEGIIGSQLETGEFWFTANIPEVSEEEFFFLEPSDFERGFIRTSNKLLREVKEGSKVKVMAEVVYFKQRREITVTRILTVENDEKGEEAQ